MKIEGDDVDVSAAAGATLLTLQLIFGDELTGECLTAMDVRCGGDEDHDSDSGSQADADSDSDVEHGQRLECLLHLR